MVRDTSIEAYKQINESGLLSKRRAEVYNYLYNYGPATAQQIYKSISQGKNPSCYLGRLSELRESGVVAEKGKVKCEWTGHRVILWDVTSSLPIKPIKKITREQKLNIATKALKMIKTEQDARGKHLSNSGKIRCAIAALEKIGCK